MILEPATGWPAGPVTSRDESRAGARVEREMFWLDRACDAALWSQATWLWISGPTHRRARTRLERCKKAARRNFSFKPANARQRRSKRAQSKCAIHRPRKQRVWIDIIGLSFNIELPTSVDQEIALFSGSCACCRARIDGSRAGRLGDCPIVLW